MSCTTFGNGRFWSELRAEREYRVLLICAEGKRFCVGAALVQPS
ncbi:hypothetical protein [Thalassobius litoralis]|nr:hypothetical protein [Thalassovita litoralis]